MEGVLYFANAHTIGVRTQEALYRFLRGFGKPTLAAHHLFAEDADPAQPNEPGNPGSTDARVHVTARRISMSTVRQPTARPSRSPAGQGPRADPGRRRPVQPVVRPHAGLAALLAPHFTVFTYDRRGRGASGDTPPYADREVDDLEALAAEAGDQHGGPVFLHGTSSGAALALEAVNRIPAITKLALYEPPFIVDGSRSPSRRLPGRARRLVADGRRGDAVKMFMRFVGTPAIFTT